MHNIPVYARLKALIERESARRLAALGGSQPRLRPIRRRRSAAGKLAARRAK